MNILITGGASGLGQAITRRLANDTTNNIFITFARSAEQAETLAREFRNVTPLACDFCDEKAVDELVARVASLDLDALVNNALAIYTLAHFHKLSAEHLRNGFTENVLPVLRITQAALHQFRRKRFGSILTILSSYAAGNPPIGLSEYVAAKSYLLSMSKSWALENARYNITANCISPSFMLTAMNRYVDDRVIQDMIDSHPLKTLLTPDEVADAARFLLGASRHINGINLVMNAARNVT